METIKNLEVNSRKIYKINISNILSGKNQEIRLGIVFFSGKDLHNAFFSCLDDDFNYQNITDNIFEEYKKFREPLEKDGWRFKTKGALRNVHPSSMQIDSVLGSVAYIIEIEKDTSKVCNIFDYEDSISEADTVAAQNAFWENYVRSLSRQ